MKGDDMRMLVAENGIKVGVRGWVHVALINKEGKVVHEHVQDNLILDRGLDYILSSLTIENMINYVAVGTSSVAPSPTQSALGNEVARTTDTLGAGPNLTGTILGDGWYRITRTRAFDYGQANANLTEFGGAEGTSGVRTRELFRDGSGNPIVITKTSNERLVITYNLEVRFNPVPATTFGTINFKDNSGNIVASRIIRHLFTRPTVGNRAIDLSLLASYYYNPTGGLVSGSAGSYRFSLPSATISDGYTADDVNISQYGTLATLATYTSGSFYRNVYGEIGPETSDRTIYGYAFTRDVSGYGGCSYKAIFVDGTGAANPFTKNKDYRFRWNTRLTLSRL